VKAAGVMNQTDNQVKQWMSLYKRVTKLLSRYGAEDPFGEADYLVVEDNYGWWRITIEVHNLKMLQPNIIESLRALLSKLPNWEIVVAIDVPGKEKAWPTMGLTVRHHEIIDGLQRKFFPAEFQQLQYSDSRLGTGYE
jgi:hypothetical protein